MERKKTSTFDPLSFITKADGGKTITNYRKKNPIFEQGEPADALFYIQKGQVTLTVVSEHGKEAVVGSRTAYPTDVVLSIGTSWFFPHTWLDANNQA